MSSNMHHDFFINATETLQLFSQPEGYVEPDGSGGYNYVYQYKDHLGNIRLAYHLDDANSVIIQEDYATSTYDWSSATNGNVTINNNNEVFNINLKNKWNSTSKYVNFTPGQSIHIEFDFENVDMVSPILYVREQISGVWEPGGDRDVIILNQDGHYELDLNPTGDYVRIYFEKGNASDDGTVTSITIDNLVITQNILEVLEENNYYPFCLKHQGYNNIVSANANSTARKFMFGGKEYGEDLGLDWYDVSARNYDPALGRWMNLDPLAETMRRHSPYNFAFDNPTFYVNPDGMAPRGSYGQSLDNVAVNWVSNNVNDWGSYMSNNKVEYGKAKGNWIPIVNKDKSVTYFAGENDNEFTFIQQFSLNTKDILELALRFIFNDRIKVGDKIESKKLFKMNFSKSNPKQRAYQFLAALSKYKEFRMDEIFTNHKITTTWGRAIPFTSNVTIKGVNFDLTVSATYNGYNGDIGSSAYTHFSLKGYEGKENQFNSFFNYLPNNTLSGLNFRYYGFDALNALKEYGIEVLWDGRTQEEKSGSLNIFNSLKN